jgi:hypothetical protein
MHRHGASREYWMIPKTVLPIATHIEDCPFRVVPFAIGAPTVCASASAFQALTQRKEEISKNPTTH